MKFPVKHILSFLMSRQRKDLQSKNKKEYNTVKNSCISVVPSDIFTSLKVKSFHQILQHVSSVAIIL